MDLTWWPVAVAGTACLAIGIALATVLPIPAVHRRLRPLAHVDRLTRLPEYIRAVRLQFVSMLLMVVLLVILFLQALLTSSRPAAPRAFDAAHPEDIMLCVGGPVTDRATAELLDYFAQRTVNFDTQRIGLTSASLRLVPLTRDYQYATDAFNRFSKLAGLQQDMRLSEGQAAELHAGISQFSQPLNYVDYVRSTQDVLALCMAGFPAGENTADRRRSLIYLGPPEIRPPGDTRSSLLSTQQVADMAATAGVQVNAITPAVDPRLQLLASRTGGTFQTYDAGAPALDAALDQIRAAPRGVSGARSIAETDSPNVPLIGGMVVSVLLCISLAVLRR